jgi:outer membrane protein assembly factor BamB
VPEWRIAWSFEITRRDLQSTVDLPPGCLPVVFDPAVFRSPARHRGAIIMLRIYQSARQLWAVAAVICMASWLSAAAPESASWTQWRGPNRDGISPAKGLLKEWDADGPKLAWKVDGVGAGYSSVSIANGRIYTMGDRKKDKDKEQFVFGLSLADGKEQWATKIGKGGGGSGYEGPRCTPTVDGDRIYVVGIHGALACLEADSGKIVWQKDMPKDFGGKMMSGWGFSESPLVDGDWLICTPGGKEAMIVALDKKSGDVVWKSAYTEKGKKGNDGAGYSSVVISKGGGVKQYVQMVGHGLIGVRAKDGKLLWTYDAIANGTANIPTPIVSGDYVFGSTGYGAGSALVKLVSSSDDEVVAEEVYFLEANKLQNHHGGLILLDGYIYGGQGHGNGLPICVDMLTGKANWGPERGAGTGSAAVVYADGHFYFRYENGVVALIEANKDEYKLKGKFKIPNVQKPSWPHPVVVGGKLYLREQDTLYCYDVAS